MKSKKDELHPRLGKDLAQTATSVTENFMSLRHSVNLGDLYAAMGAIKKCWDITKRKMAVYQTIGTLANYYPGAEHPTKNEQGQHVCLNQKMFDMVAPLIAHQEYIHCIEPYTGQKYDLDFDVIRQRTFVNLPQGAIQNWIPMAFPDLAFDLSQPWMFVKGNCPAKIKKQVKGKIIINFTERYRNTMMDYFFLKNYMADLVFAGTDREYFLFCNQFQLTIPRLEIDNFLELAYALKEARFSLSNQSQLWNLSEAMKTPRILELCQYAQNCINGVGENSFGFFHQVGLEYYFRRLYNETMSK